VLFMHPDSRASYRLSLPASPPQAGETGERSMLAFDIATDRESWEKPGDGVTFDVYVESGSGTEQVFSTYIDPKQDEGDRRWNLFAVDLGDYAGQTVTVTFETGSGPGGDDRYDWAGWGTPRLLKP
jgi:hypothetical protein